MRPPVKSTSSMPEASSTNRLGGGAAAATSSRTRSRKWLALAKYSGASIR